MLFKPTEIEQNRLVELTQQLEAFDPTIEEEDEHTNEQIIHKFNKICKSLSNSDKKLLGKQFIEWETKWKHYFLTSPRYRPNIILDASRVIHDYYEFRHTNPSLGFVSIDQQNSVRS